MRPVQSTVFTLLTVLAESSRAQDIDSLPAEAASLQEDGRLLADREGSYPAQLAGSTGAVRPSRFGPQRNDPAKGIPEHAYSSFDNVVGTHSGDPMDDHGHGTHVAGIIGAQAHNSLGAAGLSTLSGPAATAADVNKNGDISSFDAYYILQKSVELLTLPFPGAGVVWDFVPQTRSYSNLISDQTGQDFSGILLGDPSGNWTPAAQQTYAAEVAAASAGEAILTLTHAAALAGQTIPAALEIDTLSGTVYAADLIIAYDETVLSPSSVNQGALVAGWSIATNTTVPGVLRIGLAGSSPVSGSGELLQLQFTAVGAAGSYSELQLAQGNLNEGAVFGCPAALIGQEQHRAGLLAGIRHQSNRRYGTRTGIPGVRYRTRNVDLSRKLSCGANETLTIGLLDQLGHQAGPDCLVAGAQARAVVAVEAFVEEDLITRREETLLFDRVIHTLSFSRSGQRASLSTEPLRC